MALISALKMTIKTIETITGGLLAAAQLESGTFQHWAELSADQIRDPRLRSIGFYVADYPQYYNEGGKQFLAFARHTKDHPNNLVLVHLFDGQDSSYDQLLSEKTSRNFRPDPDEARAVLEAADTLKVDLSALHLSRGDSVYRFLVIRTADGFVRDGGRYQRPNEVEQAVLERAGRTEEFLSALQEEQDTISETRLYILNPEYVARKTKEGFIGRVAWCDPFNYRAVSFADGNHVDSHSHLRGVRRVAAQRECAPEQDSGLYRSGGW